MIVTVCTAACAYHSLAQAVANVPPGSTIVVRGVQRGGIVVDRQISIRGGKDAVLEGGSSGIVVTAAGTGVEGLTFRGYGLDDRSGGHAALVIRAPRVTAIANHFEGNAFSITVERAAGTRITGNTVRGIGASDELGAGDSIRVWYSPDTVIEGNAVRAARDVLVSYSNGVTIRGNSISESRYGLHDMFSDRMSVLGNTFERNEIGANFMYARGLDVEDNTFRENHGPAGYGIGLEDVDGSRFSANRIVDNHVGLNAVDSPSDPAAADSITANVFTHNGSALCVQSNPHALLVTSNAFADNVEDVEVSGGGTAAGIRWTRAGRGNYWTAYAGYDANNDGIGDIAFAPRASFDALTDAQPELQLFRYSPAALAFEFAARALPAVRSHPKLVDTAPLMSVPPEAASIPVPSRSPQAAILVLLGIVPLAAIGTLSRVRAQLEFVRKAEPVVATALLHAVHVRKLYAPGRGASDISLSVCAGESVALWGPNGAGKSTFFRCILGEAVDQGEILIAGAVPSAGDVTTRKFIGYAPQHLPDFDCTAGDLALFVAALRGADSASVDGALHLLGIAGEGKTPVASLSGGMRQRLNIALALIGDPPLLLLDEPTAGLDRESRESVVAILNAERARGKTILLTSHLLEDVRALCDRVVAIENGISSPPVSAESFVAAYLRNIS